MNIWISNAILTAVANAAQSFIQTSLLGAYLHPELAITLVVPDSLAHWT